MANYKSQKRPENYISCDYCGDVFYRSPSNKTGNNRRGTHNYCSRKCMSLAYTGRNIREKSPRWKGEATKPCDCCGKLITRPKWQHDHDHTFCGSQCFGKWKSSNWTGKDNPAWNGGKYYYYGANWERQQRERRKLDNRLCQVCGIKESLLRRALDVHHIIPFRFFGMINYREANSINNLISLCPICHCTAEHICKNGDITDRDTLIKLTSESFSR